MSKNKTITGRKTHIVYVIVGIIFFIYSIALLYPIFYGLVVALKENGRAFMQDPIGISFPLHFENFVEAFKALTLGETSFLGMIFNSLWYSAGTTIMSLAASTCTAYVVCKYKFKGRDLIYTAVIVVMMIPIYGALPAAYRLYTQLGMIDSPLILIASFGGFGSSFLYIYAFCKSLSWSYAEAAFVDGASNLQVFTKVMLPMLKAPLAALGVMGFVGSWNDYSNPMLYLPNMPVLASGLYTYEFNMTYTANQPIYFAGAVLAIIPAVILYVIFQNTIMTHVYLGGLKG